MEGDQSCQVCHKALEPGGRYCPSCGALAQGGSTNGSRGQNYAYVYYPYSPYPSYHRVRKDSKPTIYERAGFFLAIELFMLAISIFVGGFASNGWQVGDSAGYLIAMGLTSLTYIDGDKELGRTFFHLGAFCFLFNTIYMALLLVTG